MHIHYIPVTEMNAAAVRHKAKTYELTRVDMDEYERTANQAITSLIANINTLITRNDPLIKSIKSPKLLIRSLNELKDLIEMVEIKQSIVSQIKFLIANHSRSRPVSPVNKHNFEGHMLHSVISGEPGTGKTTVAMILARIWMSLGFVTKKEPAPPPTQDQSVPVVVINNVVTTVNEGYRKRVSELEKEQIATRHKIDKLRAVLATQQTGFSDLRRDYVALKQDRTNDEIWEKMTSSLHSLRRGFDAAISTLEATPASQPVVVTTNTAPIIETDPYENEDPKFIVATRADLIAEFLGQTAIKTTKVLDSARGGVLFIDEAYSICNMDGGSKDKYGEECLTTINEYMSLYPDQIIIIFAGYKEKLLESIFKAQPGLQRRCSYFFEIKEYTVRGLAKIFCRQLARNDWTLAEDVNLVQILADNKDIIKDSGGSTEKLSFFVKLEYGKFIFDNIITEGPTLNNGVITKPMLESAIQTMRTYSDMEIVPDDPPSHMYN